MTASEIERIVFTLRVALDDAERLSHDGSAAAAEVVEVVRHAREMHDILCAALREHPALASPALLELQESAAQVIEQLELVALGPRGTVH